VCDPAPACAQDECTPARDRPLREPAGTLAFRIQVHDAITPHGRPAQRHFL